MLRMSAFDPERASASREFDPAQGRRSDGELALFVVRFCICCLARTCDAGQN